MIWPSRRCPSCGCTSARFCATAVSFSSAARVCARSSSIAADGAAAQDQAPAGAPSTVQADPATPPQTPATPPEKAEPQTPADPEKVTRTFVSTFFHNLGEDVKHIPRRNTMYWLAGGAAA